MVEDVPSLKSTKQRVKELEEKRGPGNQFKPSPLTEEERKIYSKLLRRLRIKKNNEVDR